MLVCRIPSDVHLTFCAAGHACQAVSECTNVLAGQASMPMYGSGQSGQPFMAHQGSYAPISRPMYPQSQTTYGDFNMPSMMGATPAYNGGFYQDASGQLQPLTSPAAAGCISHGWHAPTITAHGAGMSCLHVTRQPSSL